MGSKLGFHPFMKISHHVKSTVEFFGAVADCPWFVPGRRRIIPLDGVWGTPNKVSGGCIRIGLETRAVPVGRLDPFIFRRRK